ncbi:hypothetical protein JCM8208_000455 [Rhodotorula glutinis]
MPTMLHHLRLIRTPLPHLALAPRPTLRSLSCQAQLAPLSLALRTPFGPYTETHQVPTPVARAVEALGPEPRWEQVQRVLASGKYEGMAALAKSFEVNASQKEIQDSLEWERDLASTVASLALHASTDLQQVDDLRRHEHYAAAVRKLHEAKDEFNFSKWWSLWTKTLQNERDLFWEKAMEAIEPTKEQRTHLVYFSLGGRSNMIQLAHNDLEDVVDISILRPEQLANVRTFLSHHGKLMIGVEQVLYDRFRGMMGRSASSAAAAAVVDRPHLVDILGQDDKDLARELYFTAMEDTRFAVETGRPAVLAYQATNVLSHLKRALSSAACIGIGGIGGMFASLVYRQVDYPRYIPGLWATIGCQFAIILIVTGLSFYFRGQNRKANAGTYVIEGNPKFRYTL